MTDTHTRRERYRHIHRHGSRCARGTQHHPAHLSHSQHPPRHPPHTPPPPPPLPAVSLLGTSTTPATNWRKTPSSSTLAELSENRCEKPESNENRHEKPESSETCHEKTDRWRLTFSLNSGLQRLCISYMMKEKNKHNLMVKSVLM